MSEKQTDYDWWEYNPSKEVSLPVISSHIYEPEPRLGDLNWLTKESESLGTLLDYEQDGLKQAYPNLFEQLELLVPYESLPSDFDGGYAEYYHYLYERGATIALLSLRASLSPNQQMQDLPKSYIERYADIDGEDIATWLRNFAKHASIQPLLDYITKYYFEPDDDIDDKRLILSGARNAFVMGSHYLACYEREKELAHKDYSRYQQEYITDGYLDYRKGSY